MSVTGIGSDRLTKESVSTAFNYFKANRKSISANINVDSNDFLIYIEDLQGVGASSEIALATFVSLVSSSLKKQVKEGLVVLGNLTIGGTISKVDDLADTLEVCFDAGARTILLPMSSAADISTVPAETFSKFNISFYNDPEDAVRKALEVA